MKNHEYIKQNCQFEQNSYQISNEDQSKKASDIQCLLVSMKLFFGLSYLSIPNSFLLGGVIGGSFVLTFVVTLNYITMRQCLAVAAQYPHAKSYSELAFAVFGKNGKVMIDICICITQITCCIAYQYFAASSIDFIICEYSDHNHCYGNKLFMILITIPVIFFSFLGTYKALSYLSLPSLIITIMGMITIFVYSFDKISLSERGVFQDVQWFNYQAVLGRVGMIMHIFAGNPSIINIQSEARNVKRYPKILTIAVFILLLLFNVYGFVAYTAYREKTQPIFIMSMTPFDGFILFVFLCFSFNSMTSYPVQILTAFQIVEKFEFYQKIEISYYLKRCLSRSIIIISVTGICLLVPNFTDFLNISGNSISLSINGRRLAAGF
eukprot:403340031